MTTLPSGISQIDPQDIPPLPSGNFNFFIHPKYFKGIPLFNFVVRTFQYVC